MSTLRRAVRDALGLKALRRKRVQTEAVRRAGRNARDVWAVTADMLLRYGGVSTGNSVEMFCDGDELFDNLWQAMDEAKQRVWHETYILEPDRVGTQTIEALTRAAQRGCQVRLIYDALGSARVTDAFLKPLREAGAAKSNVQIDRFNPVLNWKRRVGFLTRDHRKITIIDNHSAFAGGMNTSEDYAGPKHGNGTFRDCHLRVRGPVVRDLAAVTVKSLNLIRDVPAREAGTRSGRVGTIFAQVLSSRGALGRMSIQRAVRLTVRNAVDHCWITNPYFLPPQRTMTALVKAAKRGVAIRILTAGRSDVPIVRAASQHIYGRLLKHNVRIFEFFGATLHAKTMTIDGLYGTVGSFNLDTWSDKRNLEVIVGMIDEGTARTLEGQFDDNLREAEEVTLANWKKRRWWQRTMHWCAYQLMRL